MTTLIIPLVELWQPPETESDAAYQPTFPHVVELGKLALSNVCQFLVNHFEEVQDASSMDTIYALRMGLPEMGVDAEDEDTLAYYEALLEPFAKAFALALWPYLHQLGFYDGVVPTMSFRQLIGTEAIMVDVLDSLPLRPLHGSSPTDPTHRFSL